MSKASYYGNALYELAAEDGLEKEIEKEFEEITMVFESNYDFAKLLSNPRLPTVERTMVLEKVFGQKIHSYLLSFLKILTEKREVSMISQCFQEYQKRYYKDKDIILVTVVSALSLNDNQRLKIINKLEKSMNKTVILDNKIDKTYIGGISLEFNGNLIDASIKNRFIKLQQDIKNADYSQAEV